MDSSTSELTSDDSFSVSKDDDAFMLPLRPRTPVSQQSCSHKRTFDDYVATSSDPPLFSSDGPDACAEDYLQPKTKRQHKKPWYEIEDKGLADESMSCTRRPRERGPFRRNFDSGIHMGSDDSIDIETSGYETHKAEQVGGENNWTTKDGEEQPGKWEDDGEGDSSVSPTKEEKTQCSRTSWLAEKAMKVFNDEDAMEDPTAVFPYWQKQPEDMTLYHLCQVISRGMVHHCAEQGTETVDLSNSFSGQISGSVLRPLRHYTKQTPSQNLKDSEDYEPLTPALKLNLSNNKLDEVPGELYHLYNLETLSLRNNNLTELYSRIGELESLKELNVGSNQLRYLPYKLLKFSHRAWMSIFPNPLVRPYPSTWNREDWTSPDSKRRRRGPSINTDATEVEAWHTASTPTAFLDHHGASMRDYPPAPSSTSELWLPPSSTSYRSVPPQHQQRRAPSLTETVLRNLKHEPTLSQLPFLVPGDAPHVSDLLKRTFRLREAGGQQCTICGTEFVIPRTEWIEWWSWGPGPRSGLGYDNIPLIRRGCSWACWVKVDDAKIRGWSSAVGPVIGGGEGSGWGTEGSTRRGREESDSMYGVV